MSATSVMVWAGSSFASGVVGTAGGIAFTTFLEAVGVPNPSKEALEKLDKILSRLDGVARDIEQINTRIAALAQQLAIVGLEIQKGTQENALKAAIANIQTHTGGSRQPLIAAAAAAAAAAVSPIVSLADWGRRRKQNEPLPPEAVEEFTRNVITTWDIPKAIVEIGNGLVGTSNDDGTLRAWTNLYVAQMAGRTWSPGLFGFYESLEQRFLYAVSVQMQAAYLVMTAKTYGSPSGEVPESARQWLAQDFVANTLQPEIDLFLACVEKLVFSQGDWCSPTPVRKTTTRPGADGSPVLLAGIGVPPDAAKILLRSELISRRLVETFRDMRNFPDPQKRGLANTDAANRTFGIYVHLVCRESDVVNGQGPELAPWAGGGQKGRVLGASGAIMPAFKGGKDGYAVLDKPENSRLRLVRYYWSWLDIRGPALPLTDGKPFNQILLNPQDFTAMGLDWPNFSAGHALDVSRLYTPPQVTKDTVGAWTVSPLGGVDKFSSGRLTTDRMDKPVLTQDEARAYFLAAATVEGTQILQGGSFEQREVSAVMSCPLFTYTGSEARTMRLRMWLSLNASRNFTNCSKFQMRGAVRVTLKGPAGDLLLYDSDTYNNGRLSLWDQQISGGNVPPQATDEPALVQVFTVGSTRAAETWRLEIVARVIYKGRCVGAKALLGTVVKDLSLSWQ
ncbi:hypothetical protein BWI17_16225 [Betaproteobacteria bacterium GR16-43]|nr:hypothetical protein BWI17_16225 [Betaproteobacteria bacterium GR16-43]